MLQLLGCAQGRSSDTWIDFDFFGNQVSAHLATEFPELDYCGLVDGLKVPIPHFGVVLDLADYQRVQAKLEACDYDFVIKPLVRYPDTPNANSTHCLY